MLFMLALLILAIGIASFAARVYLSGFRNDPKSATEEPCPRATAMFVNGLCYDVDYVTILTNGSGSWDEPLQRVGSRWTNYTIRVWLDASSTPESLVARVDDPRDPYNTTEVELERETTGFTRSGRFGVHFVGVADADRATVALLHLRHEPHCGPYPFDFVMGRCYHLLLINWPPSQPSGSESEVVTHELRGNSFRVRWVYEHIESTRFEAGVNRTDGSRDELVARSCLCAGWEVALDLSSDYENGIWVRNSISLLVLDE